MCNKTNNTIEVEDFKENSKEWFLEQLSKMSVTEALQTISDLSKKLFPEFPKTYKECCEILDLADEFEFGYYEDIDKIYVHPVCISNYRTDRLDLYRNLEKLIICRDAYWKIAGELMSLGKPWGPDLNNGVRFVIFNYEDCIQKEFWYAGINAILAFPTEEMRDAFLENFKWLIESCKEFL